MARVGDTDLTAAALARQIRRLVPQVSFHQTIPKSRARTLRREALEALILEELKWQQAVREERVVSDAAVRAEVDRVIASRPAGERERWIGRELTLVAQHGDAIRRRLTLVALEEAEVPEELEVSDEQLDAELVANPELGQLAPQVRLRHLLVKVDPGSDQAQLRDLGGEGAHARERIVGGEAFGDVARAESDDVFRGRGGETDWLTEEEIIYKPVGRAAFAIEPGTLSEVLESLHGFHLIEVIERRSDRTLEPEVARERVRAVVVERLREERRARWHADLFTSTKVERFYDPLAETSAEGESEEEAREAPTSRPRD